MKRYSRCRRPAIIWGLFFLVAFMLAGGLAYSQMKELIFKKGGPAGEVVFSHKSHSMFKCPSCHPDPFKMKAGATGGGKPLSMREMMDGKTCGKCHGKMAFGVTVGKDCVRCHKCLEKKGS